jgi:hypothetical protein
MKREGEDEMREEERKEEEEIYFSTSFLNSFQSKGKYTH